MRRWKAVGLAVAVSLLLGGCWNRTELNELGIATATGFDRDDGLWAVTYQVVVPSAVSSAAGMMSGASSQPAVHVYTTKAKTVFEANNMSNLEYPRRLFVAHNNAVVISEEVARSGISRIIDVYLRQPEARETVQLLVTEGRADHILRKLLPPEKIPGVSIADILRQETKNTAKMPAVTVHEFALHLVSDAPYTVVPVIEVSPQDEKGNPAELETQDIYKETSPSAKLRLTKLAVFKGDQMVRWMNLKQGSGLAWMKGDLRNAALSFPSTAGTGDEHEYSSARIIRASTKLVPRKKGDGFRMHIEVKARLVLTEVMENNDLAEAGTIREMERQIADKIKRDIENTLEFIQSEKIDLVGFADLIHRKFPREWPRVKEDWPEEFSRIDVDVKVKATIIRHGLVMKSMESLMKGRR
ncbi:Ger(x)C family spore germination protein [Gorillibacterium timonense]|uniref:Ger(x)C family spore germination protein n=1 Tax=Gorillibacterium timonense TaxID=1689269 RepID=UPI00071D3661|nr:Ger(x)C family spore germination protein [Gorillibacterium timonense]